MHEKERKGRNRQKHNFFVHDFRKQHSNNSEFSTLRKQKCSISVVFLKHGREMLWFSRESFPEIELHLSQNATKTNAGAVSWVRCRKHDGDDDDDDDDNDDDDVMMMMMMIQPDVGRRLSDYGC